MRINVKQSNVRGLQCKTKRDKLFYFLKQQSADIFLLQETHCGSQQDVNKWTKQWQENAHWSAVSSTKVGVAVLYKKGFEHTVSNVFVHTNGRILWVDLTIGETKLRVINIYAPNREVDREAFFKTQLVQAMDVDDRGVIIGGDFNCTLHPRDRRDCVNRIEKGRKDLLNIMQTYDLEDVYRKRHPTECAYTYFKPNSSVASRIDYWLISKTLNAKIDDVKHVVVPNALSDHFGIYVKVVHTSVEKGNGRWQMNDSVVKTEMFKDLFKTCWQSWHNCKGDYDDIRLWWEEAKCKIADLAL